jgi:hypothetical protein
MPESVDISWNRLMQWRGECHGRFGAVLDLPIRSPHEELDSLLKPQMRVLDFGAGAHKPFERAVSAVTAAYRSMDTDPAGEFDYRSFDDVPDGEVFDLVIANQVLEHMQVDAAYRAVCSAARLLDDRGFLVATVPNAAHPVRQWDCTHVTAWPANDLYSLLRSAGLDVITMARYNKAPLTKNPVKRWVVLTVCREFRVDWCDSILAVGRKGP